MTAQDLADWLTAQGVDATFATDGFVPRMPDRMIVVTHTGGPGEMGERTRDVISFQLRIRGGQNDPTDAERLAGQVDDTLMATVPPLAINGTRVISLQRQGGPPAFMERDEARRTHFAGNYLLQVARTSF